MSIDASLLPALGVATGCALVAPLVRFSGKIAVPMGCCLVAMSLGSPGLIPSSSVGIRALVAVIATDVAFKVVDLCRRRGQGTTLRNDYLLMIPFPVFAVLPEHRRRLQTPENPWKNLRRVAIGGLGVVGAVLTLVGLSRTAPIRSSFVLNHGAMLISFVVAIESLSRALCGLERLAGFDTTPIVRDAYRSRTVSEFWRRYNDRVHDWLGRNVLLPAGGRHTPARGVVFVFLVSGAFHELMFTIATSHFTGYQLAFFTLQAPAVIASRRLESWARQGLAGKLIAHGSTILFMAITSILFFDGVAKVFPFLYASRSPLP